MSEQTESLLAEILTPPVTLDKLAAASVFASVPLSIPVDIASTKWTVLFEGEPVLGYVRECYAPGDDSGWATVYKPVGDDGHFCGETELVFGRWTLERDGHDFKREPKFKSVFGLRDALAEKSATVPLADDSYGAVGYGVPVDMPEEKTFDDEAHYAAFGSDGDA